MELSLLQLQDLHDELVQKCNKADEFYAEADNNFKCLDDVYKIKFEQIVEKQLGDKLNQRQHSAMLTQEWSDWLKTYQKFRYDKTQAELVCKQLERELRACIMRSSALKQEMNTFQIGARR